MLKTVITTLLAIASLLQAEHGSTAKWEAHNRELAKKQSDLILNENLRFSWSKDSSQFSYQLETGSDEKTYHILTLASGKTQKTTKIPLKKNGITTKEFSQKPTLHTPKSRQSPDSKWRVTSTGKSLTLVGDTARPLEYKIPKGCLWDTTPRWHPDSSCFTISYRANHPDREITLIRSSPKGKVQPEALTRSYLKPGDPLNVPIPVIFFTDGHAPIEIDPSLIENPYDIDRLLWHPTKPILTCAFIERGFGKYRLLEINTDTREQKIIVEETSDKFVYIYGNCFYQILPETDEVLWLSERSGYNHLYLIQQSTGKVIRSLNTGTWIVRKVLNVDTDARTALLEIAGHPDQDPYYLHYASVNLDTAELTLFTKGDGTHQVIFSPDKKHYLDKWSRVDQPPTYEVRRISDQKTIATLNKPTQETDWPIPERFVTKDRNGKHDIHGVIWRPRNFQKGKKYPIVEKIYAGPHGAFVPKKWSSWHNHKSEMAEAGFIVVQIDGLGTNHRGRDFHQVAYQNLKDSGFPDRIKWMKEAAAQYPEMDLTRVGIYGGSAGGQSSTAALLHHGDFYKVAVSDCGCHDNRIDKLWWNEQWLDWPINESYVENSNRTHVHNLTGHLLLTVGEMDTNVDPSSTYQIVNDLIEADKDFDFIMVPNGGHGCGEKPHMRRKRIDYFTRHLQP